MITIKKDTVDKIFTTIVNELVDLEKKEFDLQEKLDNQGTYVYSESWVKMAMQIIKRLNEKQEELYSVIEELGSFYVDYAENYIYEQRKNWRLGK